MFEGLTINKQSRIISRSEHTISRANISSNALKVLYRLKGAGYESYVVGGGVRDMLLGREPKDFDIATNARPEEVKKLFRNCLLIGRRFRLAHIRFEDEIIEVATFRSQGNGASDQEARSENGRILRDNVYGTLEEDAWRRDFTVNALYYNIEDFSVVDYVGGMADLHTGMLRLIGEPQQRYREDPVRMLRAVRFAAKLGFRVHPESEAPIFELSHLLEDIPPARLFDEILKLFLGGCAVQSFELLRHYGLFAYLFPQVESCLSQEREGFPMTLLIQALQNTDARIAEGKPVTPAFLYAALLWEPLRQAISSQKPGLGEIQALQAATNIVETRQLLRTALPKRFAIPMREIWALQIRLRRTTGLRPLRLITHPRFRAAYDFMLLRRDAGEDLGELCQWWTEFQTLDDNERLKQVRSEKGKAKKRRSRRSKAAPVSNKSAE